MYLLFIITHKKIISIVSYNMMWRVSVLFHNSKFIYYMSLEIISSDPLIGQGYVFGFLNFKFFS